MLSHTFRPRSTQDGVKAANTIGYPVMIRAAFTLGGLGSGFAHNDEEMRVLAAKALSTSPSLLIEKSIKGWKEVFCVCVCRLCACVIPATLTDSNMHTHTDTHTLSLRSSMRWCETRTTTL